MSDEIKSDESPISSTDQSSELLIPSSIEEVHDASGQLIKQLEAFFVESQHEALEPALAAIEAAEAEVDDYIRAAEKMITEAKILDAHKGTLRTAFLGRDYGLDKGLPDNENSPQRLLVKMTELLPEEPGSSIPYAISSKAEQSVVNPARDAEKEASLANSNLTRATAAHNSDISRSRWSGRKSKARSEQDLENAQQEEVRAEANRNEVFESTPLRVQEAEDVARVEILEYIEDKFGQHGEQAQALLNRLEQAGISTLGELSAEIQRLEQDRKDTAAFWARHKSGSASVFGGLDFGRLLEGIFGGGFPGIEAGRPGASPSPEEAWYDRYSETLAPYQDRLKKLDTALADGDIDGAKKIKRELMKDTHPDKLANGEGGEEALKVINRLIDLIEAKHEA
ncbi:MAG: hypothetical protein R3313_03160 [Candidatus Saccharimonadales bacterium]|nr:hypothetical protein [Candidatus Saccharimonadales bacterium]